MPGYDGTGPTGRVPLTGGGRGYCAVVLPRGAQPYTYGYVGIRGEPVHYVPGVVGPPRLFQPRWLRRGGRRGRRGGRRARW